MSAGKRTLARGIGSRPSGGAVLAAATLALAVALLLALPLLGGCAEKAAADSGAAGPAPVELRVSAASSLKAVLEANAAAFEKANNAKIVFDFGASGTLAKQIEGGAPVDVFASASPSVLSTLVAEKLADASSVTTFAGNTLVILVPTGNPAGVHGPDDLAKLDRIATGEPALAPHGAKAQEWLTTLDLWDRLAGKLVFAANAAQTDDYVARGEVDAAIGFASDARGRSGLEIAYEVPKGAIKPIRYVAARVTDAKETALADAFLAYLATADMRRALTDAGFTVPDAK